MQNLIANMQNQIAIDNNVYKYDSMRVSERKRDDSLRKLSADELVEELTQSMKKSDLGYTKSARSVSSSMKEKYAV